MSSEEDLSDSVSDSLLFEDMSDRRQSLGGSMNSSMKGKWTKTEDNLLKNLVDQYGDSKWDVIAKHLPDRSDIQCQQRWTKVVNPDLIKGPWTKEVSLFVEHLKFKV